jgi:hypothetical protein
VSHAAAAPKLTKKFYVLHQWHVREAANIDKYNSAAEYAVIAAAHSKQNACVVRKSVGPSINEPPWQPNPKETANDV